MNNKMSTNQFIFNQFEEILKKEYPSALSFNDLREKIAKNCQNAGRKYTMLAIGANFATIVREKPKEFGKHREKGIGMTYYYLGTEQTPTPKEAEGAKPPNRREKDFYKSFAAYLEYAEGTHCLDECTKALDWGGNKSGGIWATPDVVGVLHPEPGALIDFSHEIVSAEIKTDRSPTNTFTAFGQACAYCLFSHKVYLVIPKPRDVAIDNRIKSLCLLFGLGLVYFNPDAKVINSSIYKLQLPARRRSPDTSYVSNFISEDLEHGLYGKTPRRKKL